MSDIIDFFKDVICAPYSIPIGIMNTYNPLDFCSETTKKDLDIHDVSDTNRVYSGSLGTSREDISSYTDYSILFQTITSILRNNTSTENVEIITEQVADIECDYTFGGDANEGEYHMKIADIKRPVRGTDGKIKLLNVYGCCPSVEQISNLAIEKINEVSVNDRENIVGALDGHFSNILREQGGGSIGGTRGSVFSSTRIRETVRLDVDEQINSFINQRMEVRQRIQYKDPYMMCDYEINEAGEPITKPKVLKQLIDIETLAMNIIRSSTNILMNNDVYIESQTETTIQRITNHRVIVVSLLMNIAIIYIMFKMFSQFLNRMR